jgi:hypothetical protein
MERLTGWEIQWRVSLNTKGVKNKTSSNLIIYHCLMSQENIINDECCYSCLKTH